MARARAQQPSSESPLYIRWGPDRSPYAIELKLELVERLREALVQATPAGLEIGGVLVGTLPTPQVPTLRIEDIELVARRAEDGSTFMLESGGGERFAEIRRRAKAKERTAVGLFRSHLRSGPLRPSLADRTLLAGEFKDPVYALLLTQGADPFNAAFFVASNGPLPAEMSVREFKLDPAAFQALPELEPEVPERLQNRTVGHSAFGFRPWMAVVLVALCLAGAFYYLNQSLFSGLLPSASNALELKAKEQDGLLCISWNHATKDLEKASSAFLIIRPHGATERRIPLGMDELRLGTVAFENETFLDVQIRLAVAVRGSPEKTDAVTWIR